MKGSKASGLSGSAFMEEANIRQFIGGERCGLSKERVGHSKGVE